jgi:hypothetical protein
MASDGRHGGSPGRKPSRILVDDARRREARRLWLTHGDADEGVAYVYLPAGLVGDVLGAAGYRPAPRGDWIGPDGERYGSLDEAGRTEFAAVALAAGEASEKGDPIEEALRQIAEVATIPTGQLLMSPENRIRALTAKLERIANIAADGEPDEDWRPALIDQADGDR